MTDVTDCHEFGVSPSTGFRRTCGRDCRTPVAGWWTRLTCCCITRVYSRSWRGETSTSAATTSHHRWILVVPFSFPFTLLQRRKCANIRRRASTTFHIFFNWEKVNSTTLVKTLWDFWLTFFFAESWHFKCHRFLSDYDEQFPVADDISLLQQALPDMYPYQLSCNYVCKQLVPNRASNCILLMLG